ncbi:MULTISPECIES: NACHT domain-containing protein [unclassified Streptomyces]|uniref:NACHT N-terminal Helical domain 1-containing protein n=1 Tax=unclassified Streptomyces TaxID=2593676 RepID=UPI0006F9FBF5|nr:MULTISPECIES: NACHT domain-containing protein [unclassified Streptomyces]KQX45663.1 ATP-binding protein [Streptomyces sp. Root1304]KRA79608.1 ATP-binding protein [Streptomyces sp. Root66D1]
MEPVLIGTRLGSAVIGPILKKLLVSEGPGAGLTGRSEKVRLSSLVSFRGEKRTLTEKDVRKLASTLVERSLRGSDAGPGERPFPADEAEAVTDTLAATLIALGDLDMDDVQAVRLGHLDLARRLRAAAPAPDGLSTDSVRYLESMTEWACLHILDFFTQRSTFVARSLVEQTRGQRELIAKVDEVIRRTPRQDGRDAEFERRYLAHLARKHGRLTIYGVDLRDAPEKWPLDVAYLSLEATGGPWTSSRMQREFARRVVMEVTFPESSSAGSPETSGFLESSSAGLSVTSGFLEAPSAELSVALGFPETPSAGSPLTAGFPDLPTALLLGGPSGGPADRILARHDKVLLRGTAGSGKTTLIQWLAVSAAREDLADGMAYLRDRIPFVLPLRALTRHGERLPTPERFLSAVDCPLPAPEGWADRVLAAGRGLVLVDGIDEIPEAERDRARRWLRDLLDTYEGNRWLVTSRPTAVRDDWLAPDGFAELTLAPMSSAAVATFVRRWHRAAGPEAAPYEQPLLDALRTTADVAQLATNPLMCGLICALHHGRRGFLPRGRKALYDAALSMLLSRRDRERDMGTPYGIDLGETPQIQLIQRIAYWLTLNGRTTMDRAHAQDVVREAVPAITEAAGYDPGTVFTHLLHRSGLLREPTADTVDFVHRTFQDYLAAKALVDRWDIGVLVRHAADDQWEDVIRMAVGHARPRECAEIFDELLKAADAAPDRRTQLRVLVVAATALDHATEVAPEARERILARTAEVIPPRDADEARELASVGRAVLDLLPGPEGLDDKVAHAVVTTATHITDDATLPYLARFTDHPSLGVRSQLMWGWTRFATAPYAEEIIARLDPDGLDFTLVSDDQAAEIARLGLRPERLDLRISRSLTLDGMALLRPALDEARSVQLPGNLAPFLRHLSSENKLTSLILSSHPTGGLTFLRHARGLAGLTIRQAVAMSEEDWHAVAALENLSWLGLGSQTMECMPESLSLPRTESLWVRCSGTTAPLGTIARAFPALRELGLYGNLEGQVHDLTPLASLTQLRYVEGSGNRFTGAEALAPTVEIHT